MPEYSLSEIIKQGIKENVIKESIYLTLLERGYKVDDINAEFEAVAKESRAGEEKDEMHNKTVRIILIVGALLVGAGVFSFIASNWQYMSKPLKISIIVSFMLAAYAGGWLAREKFSYKLLGNSLIFLGALIYGAGIFLIGQMFNVSANWPDAFLLWMIGAFALAYAVNIFEFNYLLIILAVAGLIGHPFNIFEDLIDHDLHLVTSTFLLLISTALLFASAVKIRRYLPDELKKYY